MLPSRDCALDESCVLCSHCFCASSHKNHNVSFFIALQSGGCCDCGDAEAWRHDIQFPSILSFMIHTISLTLLSPHPTQRQEHFHGSSPTQISLQSLTIRSVPPSLQTSRTIWVAQLVTHLTSFSTPSITPQMNRASPRMKLTFAFCRPLIPCRKISILS